MVNLMKYLLIVFTGCVGKTPNPNTSTKYTMSPVIQHGYHIKTKLFFQNIESFEYKDNMSKI